jgi:hypothetical protein
MGGETMIDQDIKTSVEEIRNCVERINTLMADLYTKNVEVRIAYIEASKHVSPGIDLWRVIEHVDYLKEHTDNVKTTI